MKKDIVPRSDFSVKNPGPKDQALAYPQRGFVLHEKDERRTSNAQHRTSNVDIASLIFLIKLKRRRRTIIRRWTFDVQCSMFIF